MPTSDRENKHLIRQWYRDINPDVVVDIGPGEGTYARLLRGSAKKKASWYGVEAWGPYVEDFKLRELYHRVIISDVRHTALETVHTNPDLVIAGDVLEHMAKEEAQNVLKLLQAWAPNVIISVPLAHYDQGAYKGNWFEHHQDHWHHQEMVHELGMGLKKAIEGKTLGYYWWSLDHVEKMMKENL